MQTPIAFLIFNRPDLTRQVFARIREARPERLLVVADGPRPGRAADAEQCAAARRVVDTGVDWPCEVSRNYADGNLGCRVRVSGGLQWVFEQVPEAIVLEDDCVPHPSFFRFCAELLDRYRDDPRIMTIAGSCLAANPVPKPYSYRFSRLVHVWGWAGWRRTWQHYDLEVRRWPEFRQAGLLRTLFTDPRQSAYWAAVLEDGYRRPIDTWDFQLGFASFVQNGLNVVPEVNLVQNIGHQAEATHTKDPNSRFARLVAAALDFPLRHPPFAFADAAADAAVFRSEHAHARGLLRRARTRLRRAFQTFLPTRHDL